MARSHSELRRALTWGGRYPLAVGALVIAMGLATVGGSVSPALAGLLVLEVPALDTPQGWTTAAEVWRLATWPLFQGPGLNGLLTLLFGGYMMLWLGRQLSFAWSERRFVVRVLVIAVGAGLLTDLVLASFGWARVHFGVWAVANALLLTWGLLFPGQRLALFGALELSGATVAKVVAIATPVWALVVGPPLAYVPHLAALGVAWLLVAGGPRRGWYRVKNWWLQRRLASQRRRFKVVTIDGPPTPPKWMN